MGEMPITCAPAPIMDGDGLPCERAVIMNQAENLPKCDVEFAEMSMTTTIDRHRRGWMLTVYDDLIFISCRGRPQEHRRITYG